MYSKVKVLGHPFHAILVGFPVTFYTTAFICYITYNYTADRFWFQVGVASNIAGVVMAAVAAIPGFIDWAWGIPERTEAKKTGAIHMAINILSLLTFGLSAWLNYPKWNELYPTLGASIFLSGAGFVLTLLAGFYGWTLVQKYHVGVELNQGQANLEVNTKHQVFAPDAPQDYAPAYKR